MKSGLFALLISLLPVLAWAQQDTLPVVPPRPKVGFQVELAVVTTPIPNDASAGGYMSVLFYPTNNRFATGLTISGTQVRTPNDYGFAVGQPVVSFLDIGWINQVRLVRAGRIIVDASLSNSLVLTWLGDWAIKRVVYSKYGKSYQPTWVKKDAYYAIEPGIRLTYDLSAQRRVRVPNVLLTARVSQRFAFGAGDFTTANQLSTPFCSIGITLSDVLSR